MFKKYIRKTGYQHVEEWNLTLSQNEFQKDRRSQCLAEKLEIHKRKNIKYNSNNNDNDNKNPLPDIGSSKNFLYKTLVAK